MSDLFVSTSLEEYNVTPSGEKDDVDIEIIIENKNEKSDDDKLFENKINNEEDETNGMELNFYNEENEESIDTKKLVMELETRGEKYKSPDDQTKFKKVLYRTTMKQEGTTMK